MIKDLIGQFFKNTEDLKGGLFSDGYKQILMLAGVSLPVTRKTMGWYLPAEGLKNPITLGGVSLDRNEDSQDLQQNVKDFPLETISSRASSLSLIALEHKSQYPVAVNINPSWFRTFAGFYFQQRFLGYPNHLSLLASWIQQNATLGLN